MTEPFKPMLTTLDWNEEWKTLQIQRRRADNEAFWDSRAATFPTSHGPQSGYAARFLELADIRPGETVFDMGCGTGALATPLALAGHRVTAADFSQGMLDAMVADQASHGVTTVSALKMSWNDDWEAHGILPESADVAIASRSIATSDLKRALLQLDRVAQRRVCITLACGSSPRIDESLLEGVGLQPRLGRDFVYAFNILTSSGIKPEIAYIPSSRYETFDSVEEAQAVFENMVRHAADEFASPAEIDAACALIPRWLDKNLIENDRAGQPGRGNTVEKRLRTAKTRTVTWACLAWNK